MCQPEWMINWQHNPIQGQMTWTYPTIIDRRVHQIRSFSLVTLLLLPPPMTISALDIGTEYIVQIVLWQNDFRFFNQLLKILESTAVGNGFIHRLDDSLNLLKTR